MAETLYTGVAVGGPLDSQTIEGRFPGGILFVSKPTNKAWLYDYFADQAKFYARPVGYDLVWDEFTDAQRLEVIQETNGLDTTRELDENGRLEAAESNNTEVRALPFEEGDY